MCLEIEKILNENDNWRDILTQDPYNLTIKQKDNYYIFNYNLTKSYLSNRVVQEARGIIFYFRSGKFVPVCVPFFKFFNYGEENCAKIDWDSARILEKVDGSLVKLFYHNSAWHWATNGMIDANDSTISGFEDLGSFMDVIKFTKEYKILKENSDKLNKENTYMFELVSPYTRVVVPYKETKLYYLGERNNFDFQEHTSDLFGIDKPKEYDIEKTLEKVVEFARHLPFDEEGYVVVDKYFNRIKIKSPAWIVASHLKNNNSVTPSRIIDMIKTGENDEFLTYYPEYDILFKEVENKIENFNKEVKDLILFLSNNKFETRKELALFLCEKPYYLRTVGFCYIDGKYEDGWLMKQDNSVILKILGYRGNNNV